MWRAAVQTVQRCKWLNGAHGAGQMLLTVMRNEPAWRNTPQRSEQQKNFDRGLSAGQNLACSLWQVEQCVRHCRSGCLQTVCHPELCTHAVCCLLLGLFNSRLDLQICACIQTAAAAATNSAKSMHRANSPPGEHMPHFHIPACLLPPPASTCR